MAQELTKKVKENIKVDWSVRESTQAALRIMVRDLLDKYGYPPDFSRLAVETVMRQAESLTEEWLTLVSYADGSYQMLITKDDPRNLS